METPYNEQFRNLLKFSMRKSHQIKAFGVFTGEFFQNGTCFAMLPYYILKLNILEKMIKKLLELEKVFFKKIDI